MAQFIADESVDRHIVLTLRERYEVLSIAEENPGIPDDAVLGLCEKHQAVLITADKDFGELVFRFKKNHFGVVLFRLPGLQQHEKAVLVDGAVRKHISEMRGNFTVITKDGIRIRKPL
ncbi:MAG: DUF5615 family PIN-like protein [Spirochaetales bacterium]|nr:DUF5615 family PIN-like protein [Spirochaetales bacterium]